MNLIRMGAWALVLVAGVLSGPNVPAQILAVIREITGAMARFIRTKLTKA